MDRGATIRAQERPCSSAAALCSTWDADLAPMFRRSLTHLEFPEIWRIVLDHGRQPSTASMERTNFARSPGCPDSAAAAGDICRRTLMQILPSVAERDIDGFGDGVAAIQAILGDHFAPAQGGGRFTSAAGRPRRRALAVSGRARRRAELLGADRVRFRRGSGRS